MVRLPNGFIIRGCRRHLRLRCRACGGDWRFTLSLLPGDDPFADFPDKNLELVDVVVSKYGKALSKRDVDHLTSQAPPITAFEVTNELESDATKAAEKPESDPTKPAQKPNATAEDALDKPGEQETRRETDEEHAARIMTWYSNYQRAVRERSRGRRATIRPTEAAYAVYTPVTPPSHIWDRLPPIDEAESVLQSASEERRLYLEDLLRRS